MDVSDAVNGLLDPSHSETPPSIDLVALRQLPQAQANTIVAVGTEGECIQNVDARWQQDTRTLNANFLGLGLQLPLPWHQLWDWYGYYSQNLATSQERRKHERDLTETALAQLDMAEARGGVHDPAADDDTPTWQNLNGRISGPVEEYSSTCVLEIAADGRT